MSELSKDTKFNMSIETIVTLIIAISTATAFYVNLKGQIAEAMEKPTILLSHDKSMT